MCKVDYINNMKSGDFVYTNLFGIKNYAGILLNIKRSPADPHEFYKCTVFLANGEVRVLSSSQLLTRDELEEFGVEGL